MQISILLMEEIIKLFVIMFMGYAVVKAGLMKPSESRSISVILVYLVIPCVIVDNYSAAEKNFSAGCDRAGNQYLFQCRNSGHSTGTGIVGTGLRDLFQCIYCSTVDFTVDAGKKYAVRSGKAGMEKGISEC